MDSEVIKCSIKFERFSLEFNVGVTESIEWTKSFHLPDDERFVFAAGSIRLISPVTSTLLIEEQYGENLIAILSSFKQSVRRLRATPGLEERIPLGGWCDWMQGYWDRLNRGAVTQDDEEVYDLLSPALLISGKCGSIAAYRYRDALVLEVCTQPKSNTMVSTWSEFDSESLCASIDAACLQLGDATRARL